MADVTNLVRSNFPPFSATMKMTKNTPHMIVFKLFFPDHYASLRTLHL
jgi:hypothetical protein